MDEEEPTEKDVANYEMVMAELKLCSPVLADFLQAVAKEDSLEDEFPTIMLAVYWYAQNKNADEFNVEGTAEEE